MRTWSTLEVATLVGVPLRTLCHWREWGLLRPAKFGEADRNFAWSAKDVREASILYGLRVARVPMQKLREVLDYLRSIGQNPMSRGEFLVISGRDGKPADLVKVCDAETALTLLKRGTRGQLVMPIVVPKATDRIKRKKRTVVRI